MSEFTTLPHQQQFTPPTTTSPTYSNTNSNHNPMSGIPPDGDPTAQPHPDQQHHVGEGQEMVAVNSMNPDGSPHVVTTLDDLDPEIEKNVVHHPQVQKFLDALMSVVITENIVITPTIMFYIFVLIFLLPSAWSIVSSFLTEFPTQLYFDGCENRTDTSQTFTLYDCFTCCNNRSYIITDLIEVPAKAKAGQIITVVVACIVALLSGPAYARMTLMEHMALFLLTYGIVIRTNIGCFQLLPVVIFAILFSAVAALYVWYQSELSGAFNESKLGFGDACDEKSEFPGWVLYAKFNSDNPSLAAGSLPRGTFDYIQAFAVIFVPFIPVLMKMISASTSSFEKISLEHLVGDSVSASATFDAMAFEVDENDLMEAIEEFAAKHPSEETVGRIIRRFITFSWDCGHAIPAYFGFAWGDGDDVKAIATILKKKGQLNKYHRTVQSVEEQKKAAGED